MVETHQSKKNFLQKLPPKTVQIPTEKVAKNLKKFENFKWNLDQKKIFLPTNFSDIRQDDPQHYEETPSKTTKDVKTVSLQ